jgi:hypothetical protein
MSFTFRNFNEKDDSPTPTATKVRMRKMTIVEVDDEEEMRKVTIIEIDGEEEASKTQKDQHVDAPFIRGSAPTIIGAS